MSTCFCAALFARRAHDRATRGPLHHGDVFRPQTGSGGGCVGGCQGSDAALRDRDQQAVDRSNSCKRHEQAATFTQPFRGRNSALNASAHATCVRYHMYKRSGGERQEMRRFGGRREEEQRGGERGGTECKGERRGRRRWRRGGERKSTGRLAP